LISELSEENNHKIVIVEEDLTNLATTEDW